MRGYCSVVRPVAIVGSAFLRTRSEGGCTPARSPLPCSMNRANTSYASSNVTLRSRQCEVVALAASIATRPTPPSAFDTFRPASKCDANPSARKRRTRKPLWQSCARGSQKPVIDLRVGQERRIVDNRSAAECAETSDARSERRTITWSITWTGGRGATNPTFVATGNGYPTSVAATLATHDHARRTPRPATRAA